MWHPPRLSGGPSWRAVGVVGLRRWLRGRGVARRDPAARAAEVRRPDRGRRRPPFPSLQGGLVPVAVVARCDRHARLRVDRSRGRAEQFVFPGVSAVTAAPVAQIAPPEPAGEVPARSIAAAPDATVPTLAGVPAEVSLVDGPGPGFPLLGRELSDGANASAEPTAIAAGTHPPGYWLNRFWAIDSPHFSAAGPIASATSSRPARPCPSSRQPSEPRRPLSRG